MTNESPTLAHKLKTNPRKVGIAAAMTFAVVLGAGGIAAAQTDRGVAQTPEPPVAEEPAPEANEERGDSDRRQRRSNRRARAHSVVAESIGITVEELREEFQSGKSIAQIAEENGVDSDDVVTSLVSAIEERLDTAVENGRLTEDEAAERLATKSERIAERIDRLPGEGRPGADS